MSMEICEICNRERDRKKRNERECTYYMVQHTQIQSSPLFGKKLDTALHCVPGETSTKHCLKKRVSVRQPVKLTYEDIHTDTFSSHKLYCPCSETYVLFIVFETTAKDKCEEVPCSPASGGTGWESIASVHLCSAPTDRI